MLLHHSIRSKWIGSVGSKLFCVKLNFNPQRSLKLFPHRSLSSSILLKPLNSLFLPPRSQQFIGLQRRPLSNTKSNDDWFSFDPFVVLICAVSLGYFSTKTFLVRYLYSDDNAFVKLARSKKSALDLIYSTFQQCNIEQRFKITDEASFYLSTNFQPNLVGSLNSRLGAHFFLPANIFWKTPQDVDIDILTNQLKLNRNRLEADLDEEDSLPIITKLKQCLILSDEAKKYQLLLLYHKATLLYDPFIKSLTLGVIPLASYHSAVWLHSKLFPSKLKRLQPLLHIIVPAVAVGFLCAFYAVYILESLAERTKLWLVATKEIVTQSQENVNENNDSETSNVEVSVPKIIKNESLFEGALEYYDKMQSFNGIVHRYSTDEGIKSQYQQSPIDNQVDYKSFYSLCVPYSLHDQRRDLKLVYEGKDPGQFDTLTNLAIQLSFDLPDIFNDFKS